MNCFRHAVRALQVILDLNDSARHDVVVGRVYIRPGNKEVGRVVECRTRDSKKRDVGNSQAGVLLDMTKLKTLTRTLIMA